MTIAQLDAKRRIVLPKDVVEKYGERFVLVRLPGEILLKPLPKDPIKALREEGKKLRGVTLEQFEKDVEETIREGV